MDQSPRFLLHTRVKILQTRFTLRSGIFFTARTEPVGSGRPFSFRYQGNEPIGKQEKSNKRGSVELLDDVFGRGVMGGELSQR